MKYPFEFSELLLTDYVLKQLGFNPYKDGAGDFGYRRLNLGESYYTMLEIDAQYDLTGGYGDYEVLEPGHFESCGDGPTRRLYFFHDLYEDILFKMQPVAIEIFKKKCKDANIEPYLYSYINYKTNKK